MAPDKDRSASRELFLHGRADMLHAYDKARAFGRYRPTQTDHGNVAEAEFRRWMASVLPARYGVTSGFLLRQGFKEDGREESLKHYDVIVYDQIESPILWLADNADASEQGRHRAIPVEHVYSVLEVKATLTKPHAEAALTKLAEIYPLLERIDPTDEPYPRFLPQNFCCGMVFFELPETEISSDAALKAALPSKFPSRGFYRSLVLRRGGKLDHDSAIIGAFRSDDPAESIVGKGKDSLFNTTRSSSLPQSDYGVPGNGHVGADIQWAEFNLAAYVFGMLNYWRGRYRGPGFLPSLHGL
jgi:hypothetical protein